MARSVRRRNIRNLRLRSRSKISKRSRLLKKGGARRSRRSRSRSRSRKNVKRGSRRRNIRLNSRQRGGSEKVTKDKICFPTTGFKSHVEKPWFGKEGFTELMEKCRCKPEKTTGKTTGKTTDTKCQKYDAKTCPQVRDDCCPAGCIFKDHDDVKNLCEYRDDDENQKRNPMNHKGYKYTWNDAEGICSDITEPHEKDIAARAQKIMEEDTDGKASRETVYQEASSKKNWFTDVGRGALAALNVAKGEAFTKALNQAKVAKAKEETEAEDDEAGDDDDDDDDDDDGDDDDGDE